MHDCTLQGGLRNTEQAHAARSSLRELLRRAARATRTLPSTLSGRTTAERVPLLRVLARVASCLPRTELQAHTVGRPCRCPTASSLCRPRRDTARTAA
jgi:hypothetical protein